jgi:sortase A
VSELQRRCAAVVLLVLGVVGVGGGGTLWAQAWLQGWSWSHSDAAQRAQSQLAAATPVWVGNLDAAPTTVISRRPPASAPTIAVEPTSAVAITDVVRVAPTPTPVPLATAQDIDLADVQFEYLEPPEPGATARLTVSLVNGSDLDSPPLALAIPGSWFKSYRLFNAIPAATADDTDADGQRVLQFPRLVAGGSAAIQLQVVATAESLEAPHVEVHLVGGDSIGEAQPTTVSPRPRPGPVAAVSIPQLNLKSAVLPTDWEPPPFVVGQLKKSSNVGQGNTVLLGHLTGAAGNVFGRLDRLKPGDKVRATSRGIDYDFVVSQTLDLPETDLRPLDPTDSPRLTLMTCTGIWNPVTRDYNRRLWVIAEPPEQAAATIAENQAKAAAAAEATAAAAATATAAAPPEPTATPRPTATEVPPTPTATPFAAEVAPPGGLGNTRPNIDGAYGPPRGETSGKLVVYKKGTTEIHVWYGPDPARAAAIVVTWPKNASLGLDAAMAQSRPLLPKDVLARSPKPEGNAAYAVERFVSATVAQALPGTLFDEVGGEPGDILVVYEKDPKGLIQRMVVGIGDGIDALIRRTST